MQKKQTILVVASLLVAGHQQTGCAGTAALRPSGCHHGEYHRRPGAGVFSHRQKRL